MYNLTCVFFYASYAMKNMLMLIIGKIYLKTEIRNLGYMNVPKKY